MLCFYIEENTIIKAFIPFCFDMVAITSWYQYSWYYNYLCTCCFYGAVHNGFEECNIITRGIGRGGPWKSRPFWALKWHERRYRQCTADLGGKMKNSLLFTRDRVDGFCSCFCSSQQELLPPSCDVTDWERFGNPRPIYSLCSGRVHYITQRNTASIAPGGGRCCTMLPSARHWSGLAIGTICSHFLDHYFSCYLKY